MGQNIPLIYAASISGLVPAAAATDFFTIAGAANKIIRILSLGISGDAGTAITPSLVLIKRSAVNTGGTFSPLTGTPFDSSNSVAAAASLNSYTANPTGLGAGKQLFSRKLNLGLAGAAAGPQVFNFVNPGVSPGIVLRSASELLALNLAGATIATGSIDLDLVWTEQ